MLPECRIAFKEWAAVCRALAVGRQTIILRKGGIAEGPGGFQPEHGEFWLLPTHFHERPESLAAADRHFFETAGRDVPAVLSANEPVRLAQYAVVSEVIQLAKLSQLAALEPLHVYGPETIRQRFAYRRPGLFLLAVRIYSVPAEHAIPTWPELAGCRTWVELPQPLSTAGLQPVLDDEQFTARLAEMRQRAWLDRRAWQRRVRENDMVGAPCGGAVPSLTSPGTVALPYRPAFRQSHSSSRPEAFPEVVDSK